MKHDALNLRCNEQLMRFLESIGKGQESVLLSSSVPLRHADQFFLGEGNTSGQNPSITLVVTSSALYCFPPLVHSKDGQRFLISNNYQRFLLQDCALASLPYHEKGGHALRSDDLVFHFSSPTARKEAKTPQTKKLSRVRSHKGKGASSLEVHNRPSWVYEHLWIAPSTATRPIIAEVVCDAYEQLMGRELNVAQPSQQRFSLFFFFLSSIPPLKGLLDVATWLINDTASFQKEAYKLMSLPRTRFFRLLFVSLVLAELEL